MSTTISNIEYPQSDDPQITGLSWYRATELTNDLLREMIAYYNREIMLEENNPTPDIAKITALDKMQKEILNINNNPSSFANIEQMNIFIAQYGPIVKQIYA
jgi:hypothetical protein